MICPACHNVLGEVTVGRLTVDICQGGCGGIWFDNWELLQVKDPVAFEGAALLPLSEGIPPNPDPDQRRCCPRCTEQIPMKPHFFNQQRKVEVDTCPNCGGVWLDGGELAAIRKESHTQSSREERANTYFRNFFEQDFINKRKAL